MLENQIEKLLLKASKKTKTLQFAMKLPASGVTYCYSNTVPDQHFHSASVGKLMTATLVFMAVEQQKITLETPVYTMFKPNLLDDLFVVDGKDYQKEVTVKDLLQHTSGINDYFEGETVNVSSNSLRFRDRIVKETDTFWTPEELLNYTKSRQKTVGKPGEKFYYSDTGYILLGLLLEEVLNIPFYQALETLIFQPCGMRDTSLCFYSKAFKPKALAPLYIDGVDLHLYTSLSCDFSGGGLSTTTGDLLKFLESLQKLELVNSESLAEMGQFDHKYRQGLYYGAGMMQVRFKEFFFLLSALPKLQGHLGVTGVHAWYDPGTKASYVLNVGNTGDMVKSFQLLIKIVQLVQRESKKLMGLQEPV